MVDEHAKCKGCGAEILFVRTEGGASMPLSIASKQKRFIVKAKAGEPLIGTMVETFISHFADCPKSEEFRRHAK